MRNHLQNTIKQLTSSYLNGFYSPRHVTDCALDDAVKLNDLNTFIRLTPELAMHQAKESAHRYVNDKQPKGSLDGVTIAIKDNFCTKGIHTTCASKMLQDFIPPYNATVVDRLLKAGSVLIGKTNMDQFAMGSGTVDSSNGPSKNVWSENFLENNWRITGGSSGGSALAVATGTCYASIGSDTGGSCRNPAAYCGVVGFKPTYGLVSRHGLIPLVNSMDTPGIFTRNVSDCIDILNVVAGPDPFDSTTVKKPYQQINIPEPDKIQLDKIRIGIPKEYHCEGLSSEVLEKWKKIADLLEDNGAQVKQVSLPHTETSIFVYYILNQCEVASNMSRFDGIEYGHRADNNCSTEQLFTETRDEGFNSVVKTRILSGNYFLLKNHYESYFEKALRVRRLIAEDFEKVFVSGSDDERVDILLTANTLSEAPLYKEFVSVSNRDQCAVQDFCTQPANMAGIPAIAIPISTTKEGLPIGLQLMSNSFNEKLLFTVARWIESQVEFNCLENEQLYKIRK